MFGLGIWELALIAIVALLVLGPEKLPDAAKSLGKAWRDFQRAGEDFKREMMSNHLPEATKPKLPVTPNPQAVAQDKKLDPSTETSVVPPISAVDKKDRA